ncbi:SGNH/GDSL hydrolase family protein [Dyadobacter psychrotolerans]|uniref:SGNH/GDSL hydrolase family protein n=1 Tax=Dyadobacter psychrotolerans TaxID=2541721 RepID=A0A4V2Z4V3_9BACT|nr:SGNH/GDSL hydrolase family protein [Dyadobacter psychrotolerans]TDE18188.1 SGNH/GDSL hydrolase family protein [Dyadobacter psychrotolerans]
MQNRNYLLIFTFLLFLNLVSQKNGVCATFNSKLIDADTLTLGRGTDFNKTFKETKNEGWYGNEELSPADGLLTKIEINAAYTGSVTFAIGLIDQFNIFIPERKFQRKVKPGLNVIAVNETIKSGQQLFIKTPAGPVRYFAGKGGKIFVSKNRKGNELTVMENAHLAFSYKIKTGLISQAPARKTIVSQNSGKTPYKNILIIGNSITKHPLAPFWWGNWGMAASTKEKDFVHLLVSLLRQRSPSIDFSVLQASGWERNHEKFVFAAYDSVFLNKPDLVIIRLGENVKELAGFDQSYLNFINYIKEKSPAARIVVTGNFWTNHAKDLAIKKAAESAKVLYIPLDDLDTKENKSSIGAIVTGDDGAKHVIDHNGVANHPGDEGMKQIAERIYSMLP